MASSKDAVTSDTEGQEKPVRQQLQKASISRAAGEILDAPVQPEETMDEQAEKVAPEEVPQTGDKPAPAPAPELRKKRSHEEIEGAELDGRPAAHTRSQHTRKRSRDSTAEEDELNNGRKISGERKRDDSDTEAVQANGAPAVPAANRPGTPESKVGKRGEEKVEAMTSPKTKRSRLHSTTAEEEISATPALDEKAGVKAADAVVDETPDTATATSTAAAAETKPASKNKSPSIPAGSGFANTSATSPFGSVPPKSPPADQPQTSASAFAASGFGSLAGTATSGFGALGNTSDKPVGGWGAKKAASSEGQNGTEKATSTFGGALGQQSGFESAGGSAFGSGGSAFGGKLGGGGSVFGGGSGFGSLGGGASGGLSSFGSGKPSPFASSGGGLPKPSSRPFGAPVDEDEDEGEDGEEGDPSGLKSPLSQTSEDRQDERFFAQEHETGEEGEITEYSCRAKLYNFAVVDEAKGKKEWKERGLGTVRLNTARPAPGDDAEAEEGGKKPKARLVMRADGSHRLILNTPVQKDIKFGAAGGGPPQGGFLLFMGTSDGKTSLEMLQLKIRQQFALELYEKIKELQEAM